jgi:uncharacterized protein (DUF427 family)
MSDAAAAHTITLEPARRRWRAAFNNHVIADTGDALILHEAGLPPVVYFPREDVAMEYMGRTERHTHCPFKGDAAYFTLRLDSEIAENVAWSYESPLDSVSRIASRIAFYADRVEVYDVDEAQVNPHADRPAEAVNRQSVDEIVQHTDSGAGASQREPWAANVEGPQPDGA